MQWLPETAKLRLTDLPVRATLSQANAGDGNRNWHNG